MGKKLKTKRHIVKSAEYEDSASETRYLQDPHYFFEKDARIEDTLNEEILRDSGMFFLDLPRDTSPTGFAYDRKEKKLIIGGAKSAPKNTEREMNVVVVDFNEDKVLTYNLKDAYPEEVYQHNPFISSMDKLYYILPYNGYLEVYRINPPEAIKLVDSAPLDVKEGEILGVEATPGFKIAGISIRKWKNKKYRGSIAYIFDYENKKVKEIDINGYVDAKGKYLYIAPRGSCFIVTGQDKMGKKGITKDLYLINPSTRNIVELSPRTNGIEGNVNVLYLKNKYFGEKNKPVEYVEGKKHNFTIEENESFAYVIKDDEIIDVFDLIKDEVGKEKKENKIQNVLVVGENLSIFVQNHRNKLYRLQISPDMRVDLVEEVPDAIYPIKGSLNEVMYIVGREDNIPLSDTEQKIEVFKGMKYRETPKNKYTILEKKYYSVLGAPDGKGFNKSFNYIGKDVFFIIFDSFSVDFDTAVTDDMYVAAYNTSGAYLGSLKLFAVPKRGD